MEAAVHSSQTEATLAGGAPIDAVCEAFDMELRRGHRLAIEDQLSEWEEPERSKLLYELLRLEIDDVQRRGGLAQRAEYLRRFPQDRVVVDEVFGSLATLPAVGAEQACETLVVQSVFGDLQYHDKGGLGIVYLASDERLKRNTAIKFIQKTFVDDLRSREQFLLEAEITGRLEHPGIVPVYGLGEAADGRLFYAMRFIHGETLEAAIARYHRPRDRRRSGKSELQVEFHDLLSRFASVCKTVAYAHNRGIVHRDLKPSNVMLGRYGETLVIDWGLAAYVGRKGVFKNPSEKTLMPSGANDRSNVSGGGTPAFMSPEQATAYLNSNEGHGDVEVGPASDVYSLGATLYYLLTGGSPFKGKAQEVMPKVVRGEFPKPTKIVRRTSHALEAICLRAMAIDLNDRYTTALELAEDVERYLADAPVSAYKESLMRRLARWTRRHRVLAQSGLATLAALTLLAVFSSIWLGRQAQREKDLRTTAESARLTADALRQNEHSLRVQGLNVTARFAARTIANQIDIRWRILEKETADTRLQALLAEINTSPQDEQQRQRLQEWLDRRINTDYADVPVRNWAILSQDGTQVARYPSLDEANDNKPFKSLGESFAYRDYFHQLGADIPVDGNRKNIEPLKSIHLAAVHRSTIGGDLAAVFSAPIWPSEPDGQSLPLGVLTMGIELGKFADLRMQLPPEQTVLLVDTRRYYMLDENGERAERGEGLILHHKNLQSALASRDRLPHLDQDLVDEMLRAVGVERRDSVQTMFAENYEDPVNPDSSARWIAAFEPVIVNNRPADQADTGWFVIVQQRSADAPAE